jgi:hypothetical protein
MQLGILFNLVCLIIDVSEVKFPGEAKQNNLTPECGESIQVDGVKVVKSPFIDNIAIYQHNYQQKVYLYPEWTLQNAGKKEDVSLLILILKKEKVTIRKPPEWMIQVT